MIPKPEDTGRHAPATAGTALLASASEPLTRRLVLDTNVCLDLFVFRDPRWADLLAALNDGQVHAYTRADCRKEWQLVLAYDRLGLDLVRRTSVAAEFDALIALTEPDSATNPRWPAAALPVCRDPDDQKFLELAAACGADALVTKDKALLKLARRTKKLALFRILTPEQWISEWRVQKP